MAKTCKTCKFYIPEDIYLYTCHCPKMKYGYGKQDVDSDGVLIEDDEGWGMIPGPDFGCIHHKKGKNGLQ